MESPRSTKRRRIDTTPSKREKIATPTKSATRSSARKTNGSAAKPRSDALQDVAEAASNALPPAGGDNSNSNSNGNGKADADADVDIYDDIEGANTPTTDPTRSKTARGKKPKFESKFKPGEKSDIGRSAAAVGLTSLRARLNARMIAHSKGKLPSVGPAGSVSSFDGSGTAQDDNDTVEGYGEEEDDESSRGGTPAGRVGRPRKAGAQVLDPEAEERRENAMSKFEEEQYAKVIKRMEAKKKAAEKLQAKSRAAGEGTKTAQESATRGRKKKTTKAAATAEDEIKVAHQNGRTQETAEEQQQQQQQQQQTEEASKLVEDVPDDAACKICGRLTSRKTNVMVACDGCDQAYHQKCHNPPISNKLLRDEDSEWFCASCAFKRGATTGAVLPIVKPKRGRPPKKANKNAVQIEKQEREPEIHPAELPHAIDQDVEEDRDQRQLSPMLLDLPDEQLPQKTQPIKSASSIKPAANLSKQPHPARHPEQASQGLSIAPSDLKSLQQTVLQQLTGRRRNHLVGLESETKQIANLTDQTISAGESNSLLVIGARGCGKTAVVESILASQAQKQPDTFHVVRLNGFIHTDDKIALREIWRQLGREMQTDDFEVPGGKNYADALTTLLALLSHPSELGQDVAGVEEEEGGDGHIKSSKSVIFVLDEFDLFTTHPRQTLLYNLFDIAQSRKAPILVLGLTTRFDVAEQLEKRVKSRFSHRFVHLGLARDLDSFKQMCKACLTPAGETMTDSGAAEQIHNDNDDGEKTAAAVSKNKGLDTWTAVLSDVFESRQVHGRISRIYYTTKSIPAFQAAMLVPMTTLPVTPPPPPPPPTTTTVAAAAAAEEDKDDDTTTPEIPSQSLLSHLITCLTTTTTTTTTFPSSTPSAISPPDNKLILLPTLSTLHLCLLIAAARLTIIHATDVVSFGIVYEEYVALASRARIAASVTALSGGGGGGRASASASASALGGGGATVAGSTRIWSKDVARNAWEGLTRVELVIAETSLRGGGGGGGGGGGSGDGASARVDVLLEEIAEAEGVELTGVMRGWCREI